MRGRERGRSGAQQGMGRPKPRNLCQRWRAGGELQPGTARAETRRAHRQRVLGRMGKRRRHGRGSHVGTVGGGRRGPVGGRFRKRAVSVLTHAKNTAGRVSQKQHAGYFMPSSKPDAPKRIDVHIHVRLLFTCCSPKHTAH